MAASLSTELMSPMHSNSLAGIQEKENPNSIPSGITASKSDIKPAGKG